MSLDASANGSPASLAHTISELERRVLTLETSVADMKDTKGLEDRIADRVKAKLPSPAPTQPPSFQDVSFPIPSVDTLFATARTTWAFLEVLSELKLLFWMLVDRRYHMGWLTRVICIGLLLAILTSGLWLPFAFDNIVGHLWEKLINLLIGFVMFFILHYELRRYREWRKGQS